MLKYKYIFSNKIYGSNFIKQQLSFEISKMLIAVLKTKFIVSFVVIFRHTFVPYSLASHRGGV